MGIVLEMNIDFFRKLHQTLLIWTICGLIYVGAWYLVDVRNYIDLKYVFIEDFAEGVEIEVDVVRELKTTFKGGYYVEIRKVKTDEIYCTTGEIELTYLEGAALPNDISLPYWAYGNDKEPDCTQMLKLSLPVGHWYVITCHFVSHPYYILPQRERCVPSNSFLVFEEGAEPTDRLKKKVEDLEYIIENVKEK